MTRRISALTVATLLLAVSAAPVLAQSTLTIVYKKSEGKAGGKVTQVDRDGITVKPQTSDAVTVPAADVDYVQWAGEPQEMKAGRNAENAGKLDEALQEYTAALGSATEHVKTDLAFLAARVSAKLAQADDAKLDDAIAKLQAFRTANGQFFRYYDSLALLGDLQTRKGNFDEANAVLTELESAQATELKLAARNAKARVLLARDDVDGALAAFEAVAATETDNPVEQARRYEALLGKAECLRRKKSYEEAIGTLQSVVESVSPGEGRIKAEAYLRKGDCYRETNDPKRALWAYLHVDLLFPAEPALHAEALYRLVGLWGNAEIGKPERAVDKKAELQRKYPNSEWTKKLAG